MNKIKHGDWGCDVSDNTRAGDMVAVLVGAALAFAACTIGGAFLLLCGC